MLSIMSTKLTSHAPISQLSICLVTRNVFSSIKYETPHGQAKIGFCKGSDECKFLYIKMNKNQQRKLPTYPGQI